MNRPLTVVTACRSCDAPIRWAHTEEGRRIPLDAEPVSGGSFKLHGDTAIVTKDATVSLFDQDDDGLRYRTHFATCPDADSWRRR